MGLIGGLIMGSIVFYINTEFGWEKASVAAMKQAGYTFFFGGLMVKLSEELSLRFRLQAVALITATLVPSLAAIATVYAVHLLKGTPKPFESTLPTVILSIPGFFFLAQRKRARHNLSN